MTEYQRVWALVDLDAIAGNMRAIRSSVPAFAGVMAIVKADGYGHGAVEAAKVMLYNGADRLGVAISDEGVALRDNNIHVPVLILGYTPVLKLPEVVRYNLAQTIFHPEMAEELSRLSVRRGVTTAVHIKIDTGMSRLGFMPVKETMGDIIHIMKLPNLFVEGIYTHFAVSDSVNEEDMAFTQRQFERFMEFIALLEANGVHIPIKHVSNSGAILNHPEMALDLVRPGIIVYGLTPPGDYGALGLTPAMTLKTRVGYIKEIGGLVSVGYGRTYFTRDNTTVATIPVGYADGYPRALSNRGRVIVNSGYANIIGNICMDQFMIDITHIPGTAENDEVILFGCDKDRKVTADELAGHAGTINYEIVCSIGKRVPRLYLKSGTVIKTVTL